MANVIAFINIQLHAICIKDNHQKINKFEINLHEKKMTWLMIFWSKPLSRLPGARSKAQALSRHLEIWLNNQINKKKQINDCSNARTQDFAQGGMENGIKSFIPF